MLIKKRIDIIATGGTISAHHKDRTNLRDYHSGHYSGESFLQSIPELMHIADINVHQFSNFSSTKVNDKHWSQLHQKVTTLLNDDACDGVVVTHGTNTLEETAYLLHLTLNSNKPVILTGAQRPFSALGSDAQINLLDAVRVASADSASDMGVLVVLNNAISSARSVMKGSTYRLQSFQQQQDAQIGSVEPDGVVEFYYRPNRLFGMCSSFVAESLPEKLPTVDIIYSYAGATRVMIDALIDNGTEGIIIAGTGAGRVSPLEEEALRRAVANGVTLVMSSRVGSGKVVPIEYYADLTMQTADNLSPQKARILLKLALLHKANDKQIEKFFATH